MKHPSTRELLPRGCAGRQTADSTVDHPRKTKGQHEEGYCDADGRSGGLGGFCSPSCRQQRWDFELPGLADSYRVPRVAVIREQQRLWHVAHA